MHLINDYYYQDDQEVEKLEIGIKAKLELWEKWNQNNKWKVIREANLLKSARFSAKIEGIIQENEIEKREIQKLNQVYKWIQKEEKWKISIKLIKEIHGKIMTEGGSFRKEVSAIYDQNGNVRYITPLPHEMLESINEWVEKANKRPKKILAYGILLHYIFEEIHPFLDGNGRVGRLLLQIYYKQWGIKNAIFLAIEEYIEKNKQQYYDELEKNLKNTTKFVKFILKGLDTQFNELITRSESVTENVSLLPRRDEIVNLIRDHKMVTFDFITRRFLRVKKSTLHHDLKYLMQKKYIKKHGNTKGVYYSIF